MSAGMTKAANGVIEGNPLHKAKPTKDGGAASSPAAPKKPARKSPAKKAAAAKIYQRPRGGEARMISDLVPEVGRTAFRKFGFIQSSIISRWTEIVGAKLGVVTQPAMIRFPAGAKTGGTLHLFVCGAHAPMLQHVAPDIMASVNRFFGYAAIAQIRMAHGLVPPSPPKPKPAPQSIPADLSDSLRQIADVELRTVLEKMAAGLGASPNLPRIS